MKSKSNHFSIKKLSVNLFHQFGRWGKNLSKLKVFGPKKFSFAKNLPNLTKIGESTQKMEFRIWFRKFPKNWRPPKKSIFFLPTDNAIKPYIFSKPEISMEKSSVIQAKYVAPE